MSATRDESVLQDLAQEALEAVEAGHYDVADEDRAGELFVPPGFRGEILGVRPAVVAEVKMRAPSTGALGDVDPLERGFEYRKGGACALSILTHPRFGGSPHHMARARDADLAMLWKDIVVHEAQLDAAQAVGASAVLLIAALEPEHDLEPLVGTARQRGLEVLGEAATPDEVTRLLQLGVDVLGVNVRDLHTLEMHPERLAACADRLDPDVPSLALSGVTGPADVARALELGYRGVLVGTHLMQAEDPVKELQDLTRAAPW